MSEARTLEESVKMAYRFSKYENGCEVQRQWKHHFNKPPPALATMTAVNQRFNEIGNVGNLPRTSRSAAVLTEEKFEEIQYVVDSNPQFSIRQGSAQAGIGKSRYHSAFNKIQSFDFNRRLKRRRFR